MKKIFLSAVMFALGIALYAQGSNPALVRIPAGTFQMGSNNGYEWEQPVHQVTISKPFYMGQTEVTVGEFRAFVDATGYKTTAEKEGGGYVYDDELDDWDLKSDANWRNPYFSQTDSHPVVLVSWFDAVEYCNWLSKREGRRPAYTIKGTEVEWNKNANGYRLPTEAEWEYACRAGTNSEWYHGNDVEGLVDVGNVADEIAATKFSDWFFIEGNDGYLYTAPVARFKSNNFGLYDMHGNVWEWCWDWYANYSSGGVQRDPAGPGEGNFRVVRGGSWASTDTSTRSAYRSNREPSYWYDRLGFRIVRF